MMRRTLLRASLVLASLFALGCESTERTSPNILLVVLDTVRADHLSLYGYDRKTTPHFDAFAKNALVFDRARASASWTTPSMITGLTAAQHGVDGTEQHERLPAAATTVAEVLNAAGYRTGLFSDNPYVSRTFGFEQGYSRVFDFTDRGQDSSVAPRFIEVGGERLRADTQKDWLRRFGAARLNRELLSWLQTVGMARPWFAHVQYMDAHWPHAPPAEFRDLFRTAAKGEKTLIGEWVKDRGLAPLVPGTRLDEAVLQDRVDLYDGSLAYLDAQFGELLGKLETRGRLKDTIVVVVADHGEAFYEHGVWDHQNSLYEELVRVPLMIRGPGIAPGRDSRNVSTVHLAGTLLDFAGVEPDRIAGGMTLFDAAAENWTGRLERKGRSFESTLEDGHKWIFSGQDNEIVTEIYNLASDPKERRDLSTEMAARAEDVRARLSARHVAEKASGLGAGAPVEVSESMQEALRALGYVE
jgi:arylsulfatase A-like enzyme